MKRSLTLSLCLLSFAAPLLAMQPIPQPGALKLTILHDNDLHGHIFPFPYVERGRSMVEDPSRGGAARRSTLIHRLKGEIHNPVIVIDSGDTTTRGPLWNAYEGLADITAMNAIGYDLVALGNNEFKLIDGAERHDAAGAQFALLRLIRRSRFPWIGANVTDSQGCFLTGVEPFIVRDYNGVRVGFLGLTTPRSATYPQVKGWHVTDPIRTAQRLIPEARKECDILIAVTHIGVLLDMGLAAKTRGLDAIVGGDSHTFLYKAVEIPNLDGRKIPIVQDGEFGADLGRFDLSFTRLASGQWRLAGYHYHLIPIGPDIPEDPKVASALAPYLAPFKRVIGYLPHAGHTLPERNQITTRVVVNALRQAAHADYAMNMPGDDFFETFRRRAVTRYDVYFVLPFDDRIDTAQLSGQEIQALLKRRPESIVSGSLKALKSDATYSVAFIDYPATSTYGIPRSRLHNTGLDPRDAIIRYLRKH